MSCLHGCARLLVALIAGGTVVLGTASCSRLAETDEQIQVTRTFDSWKAALIANRTDQAMAYIPRHVDDYLKVLNSDGANSRPAASASPSSSPGVDLLLRTALEKKVPADLRAKLTLGALVQRITQRHLFNSREVRQIDLGPVSVEGDRASAAVYYQGTLTALRLPFIKEDDGWKIDVMALLPYAEMLMRVDRAIKGETEAQQVDRIINKLPAL
jgi:hypothetical protein